MTPRSFSHLIASGASVTSLYSRDAPFRHRGVGVAQAEFGDDHDVGAAVIRFDRRGRARAAAADDEHVYVVIGIFQIDLFAQHAGAPLQERGEFVQDFAPFIGAGFEFFVGGRDIIGMEGSEDFVLFLRRHAPEFRAQTGSARRFHLLHGDNLFFGVLIHTLLLYFSMTL